MTDPVFTPEESQDIADGLASIASIGNYFGDDELGGALHQIFLADSELDRNGQGPANVADALFAIARSLDRLADAMDTDRMSHAICMGLRKGLFGAEASDNASVHDLKVEN